MKFSLSTIGAILSFSILSYAATVHIMDDDCNIDTYYCASSAKDVGISNIEDRAHGAGYGNGDQDKYLFQCQPKNEGSGRYTATMRFARYCDNGCVVDKRQNWYSDYCDLTSKGDGNQVSVTWDHKQKVGLR